MVARVGGRQVWNAVVTLRSRVRLTYWYRRLRGRCIVCGGRRTYSSPVWRAPARYACGWCNKRFQHGMNYGMGEPTMRAMLEQV